MHVVSDDGVPQFIFVQVQLLVDQVVEDLVAPLHRQAGNGLVVADVELRSEVAIYEEQHPTLEVGADKIFHIVLIQLLVVNLVLVRNLDFGLGDFNQVALDWHRVRVLTQVLLSVEEWIDSYQL